MILETILSSSDEYGNGNFAPMGVHVPDDIQNLSDVKQIQLMIYSGSKTFANLKKRPEGVINFTDDILSFVDTALFSRNLPAVRSSLVHPPRMANAKTIWEFQIADFDDSIEPARINARILLHEEQAGFSGFCRAQGAILEAAILVTRLQWLPHSHVIKSWPQWREIVTKTGGIRELKAFQQLTDYISEQGILTLNQIKEGET